MVKNPYAHCFFLVLLSVILLSCSVSAVPETSWVSFQNTLGLNGFQADVGYYTSGYNQTIFAPSGGVADKMFQPSSNDFDGDGNVDTATILDGVLRVYSYNSSSLTMQGRALLNVGQLRSNIMATDYDNDGKREIFFIANKTETDMLIYEFNGTAINLQGNVSLGNTSTTNITASPFNCVSRGNDYLCTFLDSFSNVITLDMGNATTAPSMEFSSYSLGVIDQGARYGAIADMEHNGNMDVVYIFGGIIYVVDIFDNVLNTVFSSDGKLTVTCTNTDFPVLADYNLDGYIEIIIAAGTDCNEVRSYDYSGTLLNSVETWGANVDPDYVIYTDTDWNGNGYYDFIAIMGARYMVFDLVSETIFSSSADAQILINGLDASYVISGDLNNDGYSDIIGASAIRFLNITGGHFNDAGLGVTSLAYNVLDVSSDGSLDVIAYGAAESYLTTTLYTNNYPIFRGFNYGTGSPICVNENRTYQVVYSEGDYSDNESNMVRLNVWCEGNSSQATGWSSLSYAPTATCQYNTLGTFTDKLFIADNPHAGSLSSNLTLEHTVKLSNCYKTGEAGSEYNSSTAGLTDFNAAGLNVTAINFLSVGNTNNNNYSSELFDWTLCSDWKVLRGVCPLWYTFKFSMGEVWDWIWDNFHYFLLLLLIIILIIIIRLKGGDIYNIIRHSK